MRLGRRIPLAGHLPSRNGALLDRPHRLAGLAIEDVEKTLLGRLRERFDRATVDFDVGEDRCARNVHVPDAVMNELEVPTALARLDVDGDNALAEQVFARPVAAIVIAGGKLDREIGESERLVGGHLRPHAGIARVLGGAVLPGLVAELPRARNRMKDPSAPSCAYVVTAHIAFHVLPAPRVRARFVCGTYDHDIADHQRRSMEPDRTAQWIDLQRISQNTTKCAIAATTGSATTVRTRKIAARSLRRSGIGDFNNRMPTSDM